MSVCQTIKQLEEKNVGNKITYLVWSDRMDLVASSNVKGEVVLHRLNWARAWTLSPPKENVLVNSIAWRPDGKILAIGYNSGEVMLVGVENKKIFNVKNANGEITCIVWAQEKIEPKAKDILNLKDDDHNDYMKYIDLSKLYLKDPVPSSNMDTSSNPEESKETSFLQEQNEFNLLLIGRKDGFLHIRIFGCFTCAVLNINEYAGFFCSIENVHLTEDLSKIFVTVKDSESNVKIIVINAEIFKTHTKELFAVAMKYVKLIDLITYLNTTIATITETWECFLLEIDHKLSKYAKKVPEGGVTADFLDLLMFGICSPALEEFLMTDLTKKGLEKFGQTIEMSYANIQKLLLKNVTKFGQNLTYHLAELRGMARFGSRYQITSISEEQVTAAIQSSGAFMIKAGEMQQIINHSVINYKAFFRWLYGAILNLMDEAIPSEIHKMTQQDLAYITEFLQNFDHIGNNKDGTNIKGFIMERLGQYLNDAPLTITPNMEGNDWTNFLRNNKCIQSHPSILKHYTDSSLIQQFKELEVNISDIFENPQAKLITQFKPLHLLNCFNFGPTHLKMSATNAGKEVVLFTFLQPTDHLYLLQVHLDEKLRCQVQGCKLYLTNLSEDTNDTYQIQDIAFYSPNILSLLLQETWGAKTATLLQCSFSSAIAHFTEIDINTSLDKNNIPVINGTGLNAKLFKNIEMVASFFAVSGSRRVSVVLAENGRKVKLFEMEAEEDEEEDADMTYSVIKDDISMQEEEENEGDEG